ncbi:MAG TPA: tripartite tricarboxylate transporter substrate binding protein, partial [Burkholderiales bacterium]|nr:tripartite tricarboxylate transporter substrate binding protein [Burkholderiales bacterium]
MLRIMAAVLLTASCGYADAQTTASFDKSSGGLGQGYPQRPIRMIVGLPAGGTTDIMGRLVASRLTERLGQQVIVDNRPGANGIIGIQLLANAQPDGYTLIMAAGSWGTLATLYPKLPFDLQRDLAPVALVGTSPYVVVVQATLPVKTIADLVAHAKANPGKLNFAASTPASLQRLAGELLKRTAGFDMLYVPYKGTGAMMPDVLGGRLHVVIDNVVTLAPYVRNGTLRGLGVTSAKRSLVFPDLPTLSESGVPGFQAVGWFGVFGPAKTPQAIVAKLNTHTTAVIKEPEMRERLIAQGSEPLTGTPEDLRKHLARE